MSGKNFNLTKTFLRGGYFEKIFLVSAGGKVNNLFQNCFFFKKQQKSNLIVFNIFYFLAQPTFPMWRFVSKHRLIDKQFTWRNFFNLNKNFFV